MKKVIILIALFVGFTANAFSQSEPPYGMSEIEAYSVFYDNYNNGDYQMALTFGKWMLEAQPRELPGNPQFSLPKQYDRMIKVYAGLAEQQSDPSLKAAYIDTAVSLFDEVFETFSEDEIDTYDWIFQQGRFYQSNSDNITDGLDKAYQKYEEAFMEDPEKLTSAGDGYYVGILLDNYVNKREREKALELIEIVEPIANETVKEAISSARDELFDSPEERIELIKTRLANNPEDVDLLNELANLYDRVGNRTESLATAEKLYQIEPNFENTLKLADFASADAQYEKAIRYLREALDKTDDTNRQKNITLEISENYQNIDDLESARDFAKRSIQLDSSWGRAHLRLSDIYARAVSQCTQAEDRRIDVDDRAVYWLVLDKLDEAKRVDPSVSNTVDRRYNSYEPVLPTAENKFFKDWEEGMEIRIGDNLRDCYGWINETTRVR